MEIKKEFRILGIDDAPFKKTDKECLVVGTVFRGGNYMDGLLSTKVKVDGDDATEKILNMVKKSKHLSQLQCIMLDGIAVAGFNVIDIKKLNKLTGLPVIVITRKKPNMKKIIRALKKANEKNKKSENEVKKKLAMIKKAGNVHEVELKNKKIYFQCSGISEEKAREIIRLSSSHALVPEPIRIAHLIASGIVLGESRGRA